MSSGLFWFGMFVAAIGFGVMALALATRPVYIDPTASITIAIRNDANTANRIYRIHLGADAWGQYVGGSPLPNEEVIAVYSEHHTWPTVGRGRPDGGASDWKKPHGENQIAPLPKDDRAPRYRIDPRVNVGDDGTRIADAGTDR